MVSQIDFLASFAELLGQEIPKKEARDSRNTLAAFMGEDLTGLSYMIEETRTRHALRSGDWKYIIGPKKKQKDTGPELYNLKTDPGEQNNLAHLHKDVAEKLDKQLQDLISSEGLRK
jgi:arylsulfatase A-like enzyme